MNSSSSSEDWSRDSSVISWPALDDGSSLAAVAGVPVGCVAEDDWWVEATGWTGVDWTVVGVAGVGVAVDAVSLAAADVGVAVDAISLAVAVVGVEVDAVSLAVAGVGVAVDAVSLAVAGMGVAVDAVSLAAADVLPSRRARTLRSLATCCLTSSGLFLIHLRWLSMLMTSVWTGLFRSGVLSRSSSAGGFSSITVSNDVDFPLPAIPTRTTLVMILLEEPRFISSL